MEKKLEDMTTAEIKAMCYDQLMILQQTQTNIQILQQELAKRSDKKE